MFSCAMSSSNLVKSIFIGSSKLVQSNIGKTEGKTAPFFIKPHPFSTSGHISGVISSPQYSRPQNGTTNSEVAVIQGQVCSALINRGRSNNPCREKWPLNQGDGI